MGLLTVGDGIFVGVSDLQAARNWYKEKLGMREVPVEVDEPADAIGLAFDGEDGALIIGSPGSEPPAGSSILFTRKISKAHAWLNSQGVNVGTVERDRQGRQFFEIRDLEGNVLEVCEE